MRFLKHLYKDLEDYFISQDKINEIFQIFSEYYGEDRIDIQLTIPLERCISLLSDMSLSDFTLNSEHFIALRNCTKDKIKNLIIKYKKDKDTCIKKFIAVNSISVYIIVYFPKITVTNEYNESIDIEEVYIRVPINLNGRMNSSFEIIRTKYSYDQYESGYMHSHACSGISKTSRDWRGMCLGSGPLVTTTHTLKNNYDLDIWRLFCIELNEYLKVESVAGVPYIRLNRVGNNNNYTSYVINSRSYDNIQHRIYQYSPFIKDFLKLFIYKICNNENYFSFRDNSINLAISEEQFAILTSKYFIEYCNRKNKEAEINIDSIIFNSMVLVQRDVSGVLKYYRQTNPCSHTNESSSDTKVLTFKGQDKYVKIDAKAETSQNKEIYLLNPELVSQVLNYLLKIVNYGNTEEFTTNSKIPYFF